MTNHPSQLVFMHLPKTAGTTVWQSLRSACPGQVVRIMEGTSDENVTTFQQMLTQPNRPTIMGGHLAFDEATIAQPDLRIFTFLRDPVKRMISQYFHIRRSETHQHHERVINEEIELEAWLKMLGGNFYVRKLSFAPRGIELTEDHLAQAMHNLTHHIDFVGLTDYVDESLLLMMERYHFPRYPYYTWQNVGRYGRDAISDDAFAIGAAHNQLDIQLYNHVKSQLEAHLAQQPLTFQLKLQYFRTRLKYWNPV